MNKGFVSIISLLIIFGVISIGTVGAVFISKTVGRPFDKTQDKPEPSEKKITKETNEASKTLETNIQSPTLKQPAAKLKPETHISTPEKTPVQTNMSTPDVPPSEDIALPKLEAVIKETPPPPQEKQIASCENDAQPKLTADITDFSKIRKITAPSITSIEGPKGYSFIWTNNMRVPIYAPAAITFISGSYSKDTTDSSAHYLLFFTVKENCNYQIKFDYIDEPVASITEQLPGAPATRDNRTTEAQNKTEFNAGDLIGYTSGTAAGNWGFGLYNTKEKGVLATQYNSYGPRGYAVCWTDFYTPDIKKQQYRQLLEGPTFVCVF